MSMRSMDLKDFAKIHKNAMIENCEPGKLSLMQRVSFYGLETIFPQRRRREMSNIMSHTQSPGFFSLFSGFLNNLLPSLQ